MGRIAVTHSTTRHCLRNLETEDIASALQLSACVGWNQTAADWEALLALAPKTCFAMECDGLVVATTTLVCYERKLAWLGMVLTRPEYRGRGFARLLVERALAVADRNGIETVKLDATEQGIALYRKLGFRNEQRIERWAGTFSPNQVSTNGRADHLAIETIERLDQAAAGVGRSALLELLRLRAEPISASEGFAMHRPGLRARYLGPCVASNQKVAKALVQESLHLHPGEWIWDILPANLHATQIAREFGFRETRRLVRMVRGRDLHGDTASQFAIAGFEVG
jgi:GNAT superfamily N-acetyltransferase